MNSLPRLITFSLLLLFSVCFLFLPLQATDERAAAGPLAEPLTANNSAMQSASSRAPHIRIVKVKANNAQTGKLEYCEPLLRSADSGCSSMF
jgi:hypothetical protein